MKFADWRTIVHGIESRHLIHTHGRHLKQPSHLVHDADASEAMLSLSKVQQWHDGRFLVLARVAGENLLDERLILRRELEGN